MAGYEYFESSWAILSTICLCNVGLGLLIINLIGVSPVSLIPVVVSAAGAVANGLCYCAFYAGTPVVGAMVASVFADLTWLIQEAGALFYSYVILSRVLSAGRFRFFKYSFWALIALIAFIRIPIAVFRAIAIWSLQLGSQKIVNALHISYFTCLALAECISAYFLLHEFSEARQISRQAFLGTGLLGRLIQSTELRLATLAMTGIARAVTSHFLTAVPDGNSVATQVDRFFYTMECMFPTMLFIDMLASKLAFTNGVEDRTLRHVDENTYPLSKDFAATHHEFRRSTLFSSAQPNESQGHILLRQDDSEVRRPNNVVFSNNDRER